MHQEREYVRYGKKRYSKALHLEIIGDLYTTTFIAVLTRFISRRGIPCDIYSDNCFTFVGTKNHIRSRVDEVSVQCKRYLLTFHTFLRSSLRRFEGNLNTKNRRIKRPQRHEGANFLIGASDSASKSWPSSEKRKA